MPAAGRAQKNPRDRQVNFTRCYECARRCDDVFFGIICFIHIINDIFSISPIGYAIGALGTLPSNVLPLPHHNGFDASSI
jgi:hypothetical protein